MKKHFILLSSLTLLLTACDNPQPTASAESTARNGKPRTGQAAPGEHHDTEADRAVTQKLRQALMEDDSLSPNAKNVRIITSNGVVTLRGNVNSEKEKNDVGKKAKSVSGVKNVDNQLEIIVIRTEGAPGRLQDNR